MRTGLYRARTGKRSLLDLVGNTPLLEITQSVNKDVTLYAKLEWYNPSGSVKDRAARAIILSALDNGLLTNKVLIDATSGNTGLAYAMMCSFLRIPLELVLPENASKERKQLITNYGIKVYYSSALEGTDGAQAYVKTLINEKPDRYYYPDQYNNDNNWQAHVKTTGPEIWDQTDGNVTHFVSGLGTTGTFVGTSRFLKEKGVHCLAVQPDNPMHGLEGWKHLDTALRPGIYDDTVADSHVQVSTETAYSYTKAASRFLGLQISPSSAANLVAAMDLVKTLDSGCVVTIFPDNAMKYLNERFWDDHDYDIENPFY